MNEIFAMFSRILREATPFSVRIFRIYFLVAWLLTILAIAAACALFAVQSYENWKLTNFAQSDHSSILAMLIGACGATFVLLNVAQLAQYGERLIPKLRLLNLKPSKSVSESVSSAERLVATTGDVLVRDFQSRIQKEIDKAVNSLATTSEHLIKTQLAKSIDAVVGDNIVSVIGAKLAAQTEVTTQLNILKQESKDRFVQMRNRALQYAEAARTQATYFRWIAIILSLIGLSCLGIALYYSQQQFLNDASFIERHVEWPMFLLRHGPSYTFVILCEFLALIMFRYQSKSLEYMRYFSNEATNIDARQIAFLSAIQFMDKTKITKLIERLEATERNFLIGKDQRTLEIANNENEDRMIEKIKHLLTLTRGDPSQSNDEPPKKNRKRAPAT